MAVVQRGADGNAEMMVAQSGGGWMDGVPQDAGSEAKRKAAAAARMGPAARDGRGGLRVKQLDGSCREGA
jgi:hypothetical protein